MKLQDRIAEYRLDEALAPEEKKKRRADYILLDKERKKISDLRAEVEQDLKDIIADNRGVEMIQILKSMISKLGDSLISIDRQKNKLIK